MYIIIISSIIIIIIICLFGYDFYNTYQPSKTLEINDNCLYRRFGCCKDKLTPKLDDNGSNCRGF